MTKLSIIIPIYNEEPFLKRCLDSLKVSEEHIHDVEIILINDGSTDKSGEILDADRDRVGFTVVHHTTNWGVSMTRNHGLALASGEWVTFLDSDDTMHAEGIGNILRGIAQKGGYNNILQFNHYRCHDGACKVEGRYYIAPMDYTVSNLPPKWATVWNKVYKKSFLDENGIRFPSGQQFDEDREFNLQCLHYEKRIGGITLPTICKYFDNEGSICHTMTQDKFVKALDALIERLGTEDDPELCQIIKQSIIGHLESKHFKQLFGG